MRKKGLIRKFIYLILFAAAIFGFILISKKYETNSELKEIVISDYYANLNDQQYTVVGGTKLINLLQNGKHIIIIGSNKSDWSKYYVEEVDKAIKTFNIKTVYHYDINNDKTQKNSNYYAIKEMLKDSLITTDGSDSNLLAPSLYIVKDGKVLYYNIDTVAMKNTDTPKKYWTTEEKLEFNTEITNAILKYYLNNK